ncbi:MAG: TonB-dependent receptor [Bacteroidota bacterium]
MNPKLLLFLIMISAVFQAKSQNVITGKVVDPANEPIPGVTVVVKNSTNGTVTNFNGNYQLTVSATDTLSFSFVGYLTETLAVGNASVLDVVMTEDIQTLQEIVVVGYGTQRKKEVTGAVGEVDSDEILKTATNDLGAAIQGQIAGVSVQASDGSPGAAANIIIRGVGSATGFSEPLYVVDGIPYAGNPNLVPEEIETITVLKDGAAAAVYGTRASNGVILITTRTAKGKDLKVGYSMYAGIQNIFSGIPLMTGAETLYAEEVEERQLTGLQSEKIVLSPGSLERETDFIGRILNDNAPIQNHNITVSKGFENFNISWINNYFKQDGVLIQSNYERLSSRLNTGYSKGKLQVNANFAVEFDESQFEPGTTGQPGGLYQSAIAQRPYQPLPESLATDTVELPFENPQNIGGFAGSLTNQSTGETTDLNAALSLQYEIIDGLTFQIRGGGNRTIGEGRFFSPRFIILAENGVVEELSSRPNIITSTGKNTFTKWTVENILTYKRIIGDHAFTGNLVYTREKFVNETEGNQRIENPEGMVTTNINTPTKTENTLVGALVRAQYSYKDRYFFSASLRRDGSSNFGQLNRFGYFPSVSAGWNVMDEPFMQNLNQSVLTSLKIRGSLAEVGNQAIAQYQFSPAVFIGSNYTFGREDNPNFLIGSAQRSIPNPEIQWETNIKRNIGIDASLFNNKLTVAFELYRDSKRDMLLPVSLPPSTGTYIEGGGQFTTRLENIGDMVNEGIELSLGLNDSKGDFKYNITANFTKNTNTVEQLVEGQGRFGIGGGSPTPGGAATTFLTEGFEVASFFLIPTNGTIKTSEDSAAYAASFTQLQTTPRLGDLRYIDVNGDSVLNDEDRVFMGSGTPEFEVGLNGTFEYKRFDLSFQLFYSHGAEVYNGAKAFAYQTARHRDLLFQWQPANAESDIPSLRRNGSHPNFQTWSDQFLEDGTYLRLRNITIGYNVPLDIIKNRNETLRIYFSAQNIFTITDYSGFDPEIGFTGGNFFNRGVDQGNYPVSRRIIGGLKFNF